MDNTTYANAIMKFMKVVLNSTDNENNTGCIPFLLCKNALELSRLQVSSERFYGYNNFTDIMALVSWVQDNKDKKIDMDLTYDLLNHCKKNKISLCYVPVNTEMIATLGFDSQQDVNPYTIKMLQLQEKIDAWDFDGSKVCIPLVMKMLVKAAIILGYYLTYEKNTDMLSNRYSPIYDIALEYVRWYNNDIDNDFNLIPVCVTKGITITDKENMYCADPDIGFSNIASNIACTRGYSKISSMLSNENVPKYTILGLCNHLIVNMNAAGLHVYVQHSENKSQLYSVVSLAADVYDYFMERSNRSLDDITPLMNILSNKYIFMEEVDTPFAYKKISDAEKDIYNMYNVIRPENPAYDKYQIIHDLLDIRAKSKTEITCFLGIMNLFNEKKIVMRRSGVIIRNDGSRIKALCETFLAVRKAENADDFEDIFMSKFGSGVLISILNAIDINGTHIDNDLKPISMNSEEIYEFFKSADIVDRFPPREESIPKAEPEEEQNIKRFEFSNRTVKSSDIVTTDREVLMRLYRIYSRCIKHCISPVKQFPKYFDVLYGDTALSEADIWYSISCRLAENWNKEFNYMNDIITQWLGTNGITIIVKEPKAPRRISRWKGFLKWI